MSAVAGEGGGPGVSHRIATAAAVVEAAAACGGKGYNQRRGMEVGQRRVGSERSGPRGGVGCWVWWGVRAQRDHLYGCLEQRVCVPVLLQRLAPGGLVARPSGAPLLLQHIAVRHAALVLLPRRLAPPDGAQLDAARHLAVGHRALRGVHLQQQPHAPAADSEPGAGIGGV